MVQIALSGITKSFGPTAVLNGIDLFIRSGEFLTLVGPSGCGKSTLLRILAGLEAPSAGEIRIGERMVNGVRAADRNLAMVFQSYALYPHLTVAQNMMTPLRLRDLSFAERLPLVGPLTARDKYRALHDRVKETAEVLRIEPLLDRKPGQLSGGQRQRVALGRAMVRKPAAFLMDEPLSNLDAALRVHMRAELAELHRVLGSTFIYVTHDQAEALTMSDRMAVMMDGDILQFDRPQVIYDDPSDRRVAEFIGSPKINLLPGRVDAGGHVTCFGISLRRRLPQTQAGDVSVGIRPEHLKVAKDRPTKALSGRVVHRENLGADIFLHLAIDEGAHRLVVRSTPQDGAEIAIGETVSVSRRGDNEMIFAPDGKRLRFEALDTRAETETVEQAVA